MKVLDAVKCMFDGKKDATNLAHWAYSLQLSSESLM